ncbi:MAG: hypothetical protein O8C63_06290 [Candidatus Methanoperedens sp.]|nr:hypothetical protein [Candidatus Methanoperedens sp.]
MRVIGVVTVLGGWVITIAGLLLTSSDMVRGIAACVGIGVSIFGILGVLNKYYLERAIWKQ